jgi:hypothetical protein
LKRGDRLAGVIQNRLSSHEPPTAQWTMEWKVERIESKKATPGERYSTPAVPGAGEGACMEASQSDTPVEAGKLTAQGGWRLALGSPVAQVPAIEGTAGHPRDPTGVSRGGAEVERGRRLAGTDPSRG